MNPVATTLKIKNALPQARSFVGWQRLQDNLFHKLTLFFALLVFVALSGIIVALIHGAAPAFSEFGPSFITTIDWDPVNDRYGAMIAIVGTLLTSFIALLIAFPVSFGIGSFSHRNLPGMVKAPTGYGS